MISRLVRLQLIGFVLVAVVGVGYAGFRYVGFGDALGATSYPVRVQLANSGGIFTGADVTYRGVSVGRVGPLRLTDQGVEVQLDIDYSAPPIPADVDAEVHNLSAIGEQFVDLLPASDGGPYLTAGSVVPVSRTSVPVPVEELVVSVDEFVRSVPRDSLRVVVDELGTAFADTARPLQEILDATDAFTENALEALPQTLTLIHDGRTVLATQNDVAGSFHGFSRDLALLAEARRGGSRPAPAVRHGTRGLGGARHAARRERGRARRGGGEPAHRRAGRRAAAGRAAPAARHLSRSGVHRVHHGARRRHGTPRAGGQQLRPAAVCAGLRGDRAPLRQ